MSSINTCRSRVRVRVRVRVSVRGRARARVKVFLHRGHDGGEVVVRQHLPWYG